MSAAQAQNPFAFAAPPAQQYGGYPQQPAPPQQQYQQPPQQQEQSLVVAQQPSNPYAGMVAPQQPPQASPWDAPAAAPTSSFAAPAMTESTRSSASFDPFAAPPPPAPAPAPVYTPAPAPQQAPGYPPAPAPAVQDPWAAPPPAQSYSEPPPQQQSYQVPAPAPAPNDSYGQQPPSYPDNNNYGGYGGSESSRQIVPSNGNNNYDDSNYEKNKQMRNPYSQHLSQQVAGSKASGLPKAELVGKKGYVLSRISFRTIVMKKWKQSFWVQYGGHTMLWFRNEQDFNDWLNNPYHTQMQRNFLIKLAINFVHDLYKPNVRGYQVTQCRTKPYGNNKVVRQFKLERWMDYGPTIAAAFGSYDSKEVDACREAIVECMKNTPLDNGIRATGAVKEHHERKQQEELQQYQGQGQQQNAGYNNYSMNDANGANTMKGPRSNSTPDLLGDMGGRVGDDSASVPPGGYAAPPTADLLGDFGGAIVPAVNPNAAYPGAPSAPANPAPPAFYPSSPPPQQPQYQQPYPTQAPAPAYGAPAPAPQAYPGYQQQQAPQYPGQAPAPAFAQAPQQPGYGYQQPPAPGGYPGASYPVPTQQF